MSVSRDDPPGLVGVVRCGSLVGIRARSVGVPRSNPFWHARSCFFVDRPYRYLRHRLRIKEKEFSRPATGGLILQPHGNSSSRFIAIADQGFKSFGETAGGGSFNLMGVEDCEIGVQATLTGL